MPNYRPASADQTEPNVNYYDMQLGMNYAYFPTNKMYLNAGFLGAAYQPGERIIFQH